jgi:hypothetical protein
MKHKYTLWTKPSGVCGNPFFKVLTFLIRRPAIPAILSKLLAQHNCEHQKHIATNLNTTETQELAITVSEGFYHQLS